MSTTCLPHVGTMAMPESGFELQAKDVFYKKVHVSESMHFAFFFTIHLLLNSWRHTFSTSCKCLLTSNLIYQNTFPIVLHACQVSTHCSFFFHKCGVYMMSLPPRLQFLQTNNCSFLLSCIYFSIHHLWLTYVRILDNPLQL